MKKLLFLITLFTFSILAVNINLAQKPNRKSFKKHIKGIERLNLTDSQQKKFDQIHFDQEEHSIDLRANLEKNRIEMKKLLSTPNFDQNEFLNLTKKATNLKSEMMESRVKSWLAVYNILDNKQKEEWAEHFSHMANNFMERRFDGHRFDMQKKRCKFMPPHPNLDKDKMMEDKSN